ncbi:MAG: hypothetical protein J0M33_11565 [Anaerolineae bacterium]|nr:hypothetical protein [Anaerolineae bacterium]
MGRRIITTGNTVSAQAQATIPDNYFDKLVKYVPSDVMAAWLAAMALIKGAGVDGGGNQTLYLIVAIFGLIVTPLWVWRQTTAPGQAPDVVHIGMSTFAFAVWALNSNGTDILSTTWQPLYGLLLIILFTVLVGIVKPTGTQTAS